VQAYGGSYSSVTSSGNIRDEIRNMRFSCNEVTCQTDGSATKKSRTPRGEIKFKS